MTIFKDVVFYLDIIDPNIEQQLETHGATRATLPDDWSRITHVITTDLNQKVAQLAQKKGIAVVNANWVEVSIRRKHLQNIKYFSVDPRYFFTGLVITCVELPYGDQNAIYEGVLALGGQYSEILSKNITHIITFHLDNETCKQVTKRPELGIKIVSPDWFNDCLKQRRRVDEIAYLLTDSVCDIDQSGIGTDSSCFQEKMNSIFEDSDETTSKIAKHVLKNKKILFSKDLGISQGLLHALETITISFGATIVSSVKDATVFIGMYREGNEYIQAARQGIVIGNLVWLYYMFVYETWVDPERNLLHYPIVKNGLSEMQEMIITISNYQGESRKYLEKLIKALGATFTKNMTPNNTHLIVPCQSGQKYTAALEWNIYIVNHLWLEETYAKWKVQNITTPRYICFLPKTNLMEIVGNTPIDVDVIKPFYENMDHDCVIEKSPLKESNLLEHSNDALLNNNKLPLDLFSSSLDINSTSNNDTFLNTHNDNQGSLTLNCSSSVKENIPTFHKRRAATVALERLHNEIMPDVLLYQKERKRKTYCVENVINTRKKSKELSIEFGNVNNDEISTGKTLKAKRSVTNKDSLNYDIRLLITGYKDWNDQIEKALLILGMATVQDAKDCTHLIACRIQRTQKFLTALPYAPKILSVDWIKACLKEKKIVDENDYFLVDLESEMKYNFKLSESLKKASENKHSLFKGYLFQVSPMAVSNYSNGIDTVKHIIEANGGVCVLTASRKDWTEYKELSPILIANGSDERILKQFIEKRREAGEIPLIYNMEWVLTTVLRQELDFTSQNSLLE